MSVEPIQDSRTINEKIINYKEWSAAKEIAMQVNNQESKEERDKIRQVRHSNYLEFVLSSVK